MKVEVLRFKIRASTSLKEEDIDSKCKNIFGSLEGPELLLMMLDVKIAKAKSKFPGVDIASSLKESISLFKDFYEESKKKYGHVSSQALDAIFLLKHALMDSDQCIQYERQMMLSHQVTCQLNGFRHQLAKVIKDKLDDIQVKGAEMAAGPHAN